MNKEAYLRNKGVNIDAALNYTGDFETYNEIFGDFMLELDNQITNLTNVLNSNDMPNYAIQVHALKSNVRCLGFDNYASIAYNHEMASKQNDSTYVKEHYNEILTFVNELKALYEEYKNIN